MAIWTSGERGGNSGGEDHHPFISNRRVDQAVMAPEKAPLSLPDIAVIGSEVVRQTMIPNESGGFDDIATTPKPDKYRADLPA